MDISSVTLHQLRIFHAVVRSGNLTRAAEQLGISQPAVSVQIKQLERALGVPLLETVGRTQKLTENGLTFDGHAVQVLNEFERLTLAMKEIRGIEGGRLTVGADTTVGIYVIPPVLGTWHQSFPLVEIDLRVGNHDTVTSLLRNNEVDFAVVSTIPALAGLESTVFMPNRLVIVAPPQHELAGNSGPHPATILQEYPVLVREGGSSTSATLEQFCRAHHIEMHVSMRLGSIGAIKQGVASGLGLGVVSERAIGNELEIGALVVLDVVGFPLELMWNIVHYRDKRLSPAARSFRAFLEQSRSVLEQPSVSRAPSRDVPQRLKEQAKPTGRKAD